MLLKNALNEVFFQSTPEQLKSQTWCMCLPALLVFWGLKVMPLCMIARFHICVCVCVFHNCGT